VTSGRGTAANRMRTAAIAMSQLLVLSGCLRAQVPVSMRADDGGYVSGDSYGSGTRGVVLAHGGRFDRSSWAEQAQQLAAAGFRVIAIDFRASVESRAGRETPCLYDEACLAKDVLAAVRYLRDQGVRTVSLVGASMGGGAVAQASADAAPGEIDRIVLLAHMPIETPERMSGRKLFVVARNDTTARGVRRLVAIEAQYASAPAPKELLVLDGSAHAQFLFRTDEAGRLMRAILRFLNEEP
jgi:pimeloyl-ACP methyl ester carboxylesterase